MVIIKDEAPAPQTSTGANKHTGASSFPGALTEKGAAGRERQESRQGSRKHQGEHDAAHGGCPVPQHRTRLRARGSPAAAGGRSRPGDTCPASRGALRRHSSPGAVAVGPYAAPLVAPQDGPPPASPSHLPSAPDRQSASRSASLFPCCFLVRGERASLRSLLGFCRLRPLALLCQPPLLIRHQPPPSPGLGPVPQRPRRRRAALLAVGIAPTTLGRRLLSSRSSPTFALFLRFLFPRPLANDISPHFSSCPLGSATLPLHFLPIDKPSLTLTWIHSHP
ncbi:uncharacterized protein [Pithys albifrons albifrons]|uniref:uncharacterized protein n=1 Tax=Pithys albifrons albifrons TaxID=3385563 RepID=UPI003A5CE3C0